MMFLPKEGKGAELWNRTPGAWRAWNSKCCCWSERLSW